jgi:hypothetical protein
MNLDSDSGQRKRDTPCTDSELDCSATGCDLGKKFDCRPDHSISEFGTMSSVVRRGDALAQMRIRF